MEDFEQGSTVGVLEETEQSGSTPAVSPDQGEGGKKKHIGGILGALAILLFKFKGVLLILFTKFKVVLVSLKFLKLGKLLTTLGSMGATIVIDAMRWGWSFAVGFVFLIFVHEMGHVLAIRAKGLKAGAPVFIPFVGAFIALKDMPPDAKTEAQIGIAGPVLGTLGAFLFYWIGNLTGMELLVRLSYFGFFLNLFNLLPVLPLDGGRVMSAISPKIWILGLVLSAGLFLFSHNPIFLIIVLLSVGRMWQAIKTPADQLPYYSVPGGFRTQMTFGYFGLVAALAFMMMELHHRSPLSP